MASYYFQEDSSDESLPSPSTAVLDPHICNEPEHVGHPLPTQNQENGQAPSLDQNQDASDSPTSSAASTSSPPSETNTSPPSHQSRSTYISTPSVDSIASPKPTSGPHIVIGREPSDHQLREDAKSLAVLVEDQFLLARSDLEESLLNNLFGSVRSLESTNVRVLHASTDKHLPWATQEQQRETDLAMMRFVPQTRVFFINKQYRTVFLVDVSSSVLTVDASGSRIVMGQVMDTLTKCLVGLSENFSCPGMKEDYVLPEIHITVIAECSQFASNVHTGEMLSNFPTMKVLLQDVVLTQSNLHSILKVLKVQLAKFQVKLSKFRGELRRTRESMGYSLAVEDTVGDESLELDFEDDISRRKSWGVGLSGANLSYTLTAGLFALGLMPQSASPSLVIVTDGVVKSNLLHGSTILRRLMELDVSCSVIQLGNKDGSVPSCNWGFIQDTEALRYVAEATLGKFMFSQECASIDPHSMERKLDERRTAPNMYHRTFLIRELCLLKPRPGLDDVEDKDDSVGYSMTNFPWDPKSQPEPIKMMQTACKDYHLNIPVEILVTARIRQGFRIKGVSVVPDKDRPSSERYLITMTMTWLPNVTIQYKLKGQVDSETKSTNFLQRFEPPKVEIDIIAYQAFAIHFLNSQHTSVSANHSVYAKVFRIHRYIVGLSDSDVTLRGLNNSHVSANQALWTQRTKSIERSRKAGDGGIAPEDQDREDIAIYLSRLAEQWTGLAKDADRQYSRCWYNDFEFDAFLVVPPPAFLPTSMDTKNSLVKYCESLETTISGIRDYLKRSWASFVVGDVFVQTQQQPELRSTSTASSRFCELRLFSEPNVAILRVQLRFFGIPSMERKAISDDIQRRIFGVGETVKPHAPPLSSKDGSKTVRTTVLRCQRPIYRLLMRHLIHEAPLSHTPETTSTDFHTHVAEPIGEESVLRSYLLHKHWGWKDQVRDSAYLSDNGFMASQDLAFQYLCAQRIGEGFLLASSLPNRVVLCKEVDLPPQEGSLLRGTYAVQYLIFRSPVSGELVTELWVEPVIDVGQYSTFDKVKTSIINVDRFLLSRLATFEAIHTIGRLRLRPTVELQPDRGFIYPWLFDPATLLRQQRLITLAYEAPKRNMSLKVEPDVSISSTRRCTHALGLTALNGADSSSNPLLTSSTRDLLLTRNANASSTSLTQSLLDAELPVSVENELVSEYKEYIRELSCADRDLAILHLFMEKSLSQLAEGEIMAGNDDDACSQFFLDIKTSIKQNPDIRRLLMTFHCTNSFQDIRCFVKIPNARFVRLIIIPKLGSVIAHIAKMRSLQSKEGEVQAELARNDFLSCMMFECLRSKPLADVSEHNASALDQSLALFELHPVSLGPVVMHQPLLLQPIMNEDQGRATKVHESTLQLIRAISQTYSHSYAKAIFAALIEGHSVEPADLQKATLICTRTSVDINITGFLNTLELVRHRGTVSGEAASELATRFMQVLQHSFELSPVSGPDQIFFYRPAIRRTAPKQAKPKTRKRSPSVSRQGPIDEADDNLAEIIESAERPLFMHLECSFQKPLTQSSELERNGWKSSVTFPVSDLPLSYNYREKGSHEHNYAPSCIGFDSRPVDSADGTVAILHLVVSTLPLPDEYNGPTLKSIDSESKINIETSQQMGVASRNLQHLFPSLDPTQLEAISDTESRLEWLVKEEIMHGLLNITPITVDILSLVESQLKTKTSFVNFPTSMTLPLTFVKRKRGYEIFMQELGRTSMLPYELCQVGPYFHLTETESDAAADCTLDLNSRRADMNHSAHDSRGHHDSSQAGVNSPGLPYSEDETSSTSPPPSDLCHGLGIVILPTPKDKLRSTTSETGDVHSLRDRRGPKREFWLILVPKESYVQVHFFSKTLSEESCRYIVNHVRRAIDELCIKVNQLTLLQSLNESRNCSKYLVPADDSDPNVGSSSSSDSDHVSQEDEALVTGGSRPDCRSLETKKFKPGEFACPLVYRRAWPLHWRVKPGQAMKSVAHLVLFPFAVQNRKNFFVVESKDDHDDSKKIVVFLRLSEADVQASVEATPGTEDGSTLVVSKAESMSQVPTANQTTEDTGSHSNSPRPSPTASPGSRTVAPTGTRTDTRELVVEVYGVQPPGRQVTGDLFSHLENKFYNSVVLSVVSTFLSRNSTLKLTQADVDFILPVDRMEPARQVLEIPYFITTPFAFLMYLKQNLSLYLHPLMGADKVGVLTRHYQSQYGRLSTGEQFHDRQSQHTQIGDFAFFYNAVQGRSPTQIESSVGIGLAGVCLTVLGHDRRPVFEIGHQEGNHDNEGIRAFFESFPDSAGLKPSKYSLLVEVWAQGAVNASALLDAISQSFRQSLCDDIIESSIAQGLCPSAQDRKNDLDQLDGEPLIGECVQKNFIDPSFLVLQHSFQWRNPAVHSLNLEYSMPPWIMDSFLLELDEILTDVSVGFSPLLIRSIANSHRYKEHKASSGSKKSFGDMTNIRFILVGGIQDLNEGSSTAYYGRRASMGNDRVHSRRSSLAESVSFQHSHKTSTHSSQHIPKRQLEDVKMYPNAITASGQDETMLLTRNCFVVITANGFGLQAYTYNWGKAYQEVFSAIERLVKWHQDRMRLLDNVLLQKMGLFHHVPCISPPQTLTPIPSASGATPSLPRPGPQSSPHLGSNLRMGLSDPAASSTSIPKLHGSPKNSSVTAAVSDTATLAYLVDDQFPSRTRPFSAYNNDDSRSENQKSLSNPMAARPSPPAAATPTHSLDQNSPLVSSVITTGLDIDQILRDYILEPLETARDENEFQDEVQRHARPFLDTFMHHTKNAEDQQNAYNVYQKWSRRYKDRKGSPNALHENMNTSDLAIMLRSARLLHFCRTPLLFTEFSSSLFPLVDPMTTPIDAGTNQLPPEPATSGQTGGLKTPLTDSVVRWYRSLAETFMREYSQYLGTVGMQLLMYGNSKFDKPVESVHSDELSFMSQFTVSKSLSVASPAAFLFKSLQGGSIMCEVRLQGMFVCVTLYTLNRRYGRVKVAAPGFATAEANKHSLRVYTEQCARFKDRIHVNSFVYDFHLRYIHRILMESSKLSTGTGSQLPTSLPFSFDLLDVLHQFLQYHSRPAAYSRNRVYRGVYHTTLAPGEGELPGHLFNYVIKNPQRYGFQAIHLHDRPKACFVSGRNLLAGFGGLQQHMSSAQGSSKGVSGNDKYGLKGFGVGGDRGGLPMAHSQRSTGPHLRHTSHDSSLNTKRNHKRLPSSRSSYNVKESTILDDEGVEYVLVLSDGDQDNTGLTVHYYLLILREEEVVKKLEEAHGPLLKAKDRLLAANHNVVIAEGNIGVDRGHIGSHLGTARPRLNYAAAEDGHSLLNHSVPTELLGDEKSTHTDPTREILNSEGRLMDATELQERITERAALGDVVRAAEVRLDLLLKQAAQFFDRDSLWEMLVQGKIDSSGIILTGSNSSLLATQAQSTPLIPEAKLRNESREHGSSTTGDSNIASRASELGFADFLALGQRFHSTPLEEMEPDFLAIVTAPGIDWGEVLSFLASYYARWAREFMEHDETSSPGPAVSSLRPGLSDQGGSSGTSSNRTGSIGRQARVGLGKGGRARRHLVIFNPHNRDLLVHFVINMNTDSAASGPEESLESKEFTSACHHSGETSQNTIWSSTGDLSSRFHRLTPGGQKLHSQSHSQLQGLLQSSSQTPSPGPDPLQREPAQVFPPPIRPSLSEVSSRVSSVTSIARAASIAVSKVASRFQPSRSRDSTSALHNHNAEGGGASPSGTGSRAPSVIMDDDVRSILTKESTRTTSKTPARFSWMSPERPRLLQKSRQRTEEVQSIQDEEDSSDGEFDQHSLDHSLQEGEDEDYDHVDIERGYEDGGGQEVEDDQSDNMGTNVRVFSVSREPKSGYNAIESDHVGDVIRTLSYWLWRSQK